MADTTAPSTPTGSSSPPSSTPATSVDKNASATAETKPDADAEMEVLTLEDSSSDVEMMEADDKEQDGDKEEEGKKASEGKKRKSKETPSSAPSSKKSKSASSSASGNKKPAAPKAAASTKKDKAPAGETKKEKGIVSLNLKLAKLEFKQKPLDVKMADGYSDEVKAFVKYATGLFNGSATDSDSDEAENSDDEEDKKKKKSKSKKSKAKAKNAILDDWPEEHHALVAKLVHESSATLGSVAGAVKKELVKAIEQDKMMNEDSQEDDEGTSIKDRLPIAPLKNLISTLATRTNYGLSSSSPSVTLPDGVKDVPDKLCVWCWEVKEERFAELAGEGLGGKWERRRGEREQAQKDALDLFESLTPEQQAALLSGTAAKASSSSASAAAAPASKGKAKAKASSPVAESEGEEDGDDEGEKGGKEKKPVKEKVKKEKVKKELTEEQKKEAEEKARLKAEKDAEKEAKRKEREEKKAEKDAAKAEKDAAKAEKERVKREREEEEERKEKAKKKQANAFTSFFTKTSPAPEAGPSKASSTPQKAASPALGTNANADASTSASSGSAAKPKAKGFDDVFFPFKVRESVEMAEVTWDAGRRRNGGKEVEVREEGEMSRETLLTSLRTRRPRIRLTSLAHYPSPPVTVRSAVNAISDAGLTNNDVSEYYDLLNDRGKVAVKMLKFREDVRPGYIGTWTKTSRVVGFRTPFAKESALLNYDYDSEAEWEEEPEGEGEDVNSDGEEEKDDPGAASEADSWLAEDDEIEYEEGYEEEGDVVMLDAEGKGGRRGGADDSDDEVVFVKDEIEEKRRRKIAEKKKKDAEQQKKRRVTLARPVIKGLAWEDEQGKSSEPLFKAMKVQFLNDASFGLNPFTFVSKPFAHPSAASSSAAAAGKGKENVVPSSSSAAATAADGKPVLAPVPAGQVNVLKAKKGAPAKPFPAEHLARFVHFINGSDKTKIVLVDEFVRVLKGDGVAVTKGSVEAKFAEITNKRVNKKQVVKEEVLAQLGIAASA
ncbi:hypothetical protein JCM6882_005506 [Rhodosporidiobolus microsporus]